MKRHPAVHHNKNKLCSVSFFHNGKFISMKNQRFNSRQDAESHVRTFYPGASKFSAVFFVPHPDTMPRVPRVDTYDNETEEAPQTDTKK